MSNSNSLWISHKVCGTDDKKNVDKVREKVGLEERMGFRYLMAGVPG